MPKITPPKDNPEKQTYVVGFKGVNTLQDSSLIDNRELSLMRNGRLVVDGIRKRQGSINYGDETNSRVYGGTGFYTSDGDRFIVREGGTSLLYYDSNDVAQTVSGATMTASKRTEFAMARDALYVQNGTDALVKVTVSGGVPTATTYTALTTPTGLAVAAQGTTGSTNYSYRVTAINAVGETLAATSVTISNGNSTLDSTNFNRVTWDAVSGATGYVIYGREGTAYNGVGETKLAQVGTGILTYDDTGADTPSTTITPPEGNSTGGQAGSMIIFAIGRLWVSGDSNNPSRLYYSGAGTQIGDFSTAYAGGWVDVSRDDGDFITGIAYYQNFIIVFKNKSIWKFTFTDTGLPKLELVTNELGCASHRTIKIADNDLWFLAKKDGQAVVCTVGNVRNYFGALRTIEKSLPMSSDDHLGAVNVSQLSNASATYFRNKYILSLAQGSSTVNDRAYVYDVQFDGWLGYWDGFSANSYFIYDDGTNEDLYFCDDESGYVVKMFTGTDDNGTAVTWQLKTKAHNQDRFDVSKIYRNPRIWLKDVSGGSLTAYIINDGIYTSGNFNISPIVSGIGAGYDIVGTFLAGDSEGASTTSGSSDQPIELTFTKEARTIQFQLDDNNASSDFLFLGYAFNALLLEGKPLPATNRIRVS